MRGRLGFVVVWAGQVVSVLGSNLTAFALGVWLYRTTGSASPFALVALCTALPQMLVSPFAGVLVDRHDRRWMMAAADGGAALCTLALALLFWGGGIRVWQVLAATALASAFGALQAPAYSALVASTVESRHLGRANGLLQTGDAVAEVLGPSIAGVLVITVGVTGVLLTDLATFGVAVLALAAARLPRYTPQPRPAEPSGRAFARWRRDLGEGWQALRADRGLFALLGYQALFSFLWSVFAVLVVPMILGFASPDGLGVALSVAGAGMLAGGLLMTAWGGPRHLLTGVLVFELASAAGFCLMGARPSLVLVASAAFVAHLTLAFVSSLSDTIWQRRTAQELLGRVLALRQTVVKASRLVAYLVAAAVADRLVEPLLRPAGALAPSLGRWFGVGPGRGLALLFFLIGVVKAVAVVWVYLAPSSRALDESLAAARDESAA